MHKNGQVKERFRPKPIKIAVTHSAGFTGAMQRKPTKSFSGGYVCEAASSSSCFLGMMNTSLHQQLAGLTMS